MNKQQVKLVVTDFDNTLYDWFEGWYTYFNRVLNNMSTISGIDIETLKSAIRPIHQKYGTSEYSHLLDELDILFENNKLKRGINDYTSILESAFIERNNALKLYDTVLDSLNTIKNKGASIAVYTESQPLYSVDRLVKLNLDGVVDVLYAPLTQTSINNSKSIYNSLQFSQREESVHTIIRSLPKEDIKPNPKVLLDIISHFNVDIENVIYIGDSPMKDICMANNAGITSVLVKFGASSHKNAYNVLRQVSHWTDEDVEKEKNMPKESCLSQFELKESFSELLDIFDFEK